MTALGSLLTEVGPGFACGKEDADGIFQFRMHNISKSSEPVLDKRRRVPRDAHKQLARFHVRPGDVLFNATNSPDGVGKSILVPNLDEPAVFSNHFLRLRVHENLLNPASLGRWLQYQYSHGVFLGLTRQWVNQATVSRDDLLALDIPELPLDEQRRIAAILDHADTLRAKRRQALAHLNALPQAMFRGLLGTGAHRRVPLAEIADVSSGITKGRRTTASTRAVPYLAVANVQAGHLALDNVKTIDATDAEVQRYALQPGDLVLTEGGDPDKLGRGTLWRGEIAECIHQNHIFRVRLKPGAGLRAEIQEPFLGGGAPPPYSPPPANQTPGPASNKRTHLAALPVPPPPLDLQKEFYQRLAAFRTHASAAAQHWRSLDAAFASLQARAFKGEL